MCVDLSPLSSRQAVCLIEELWVFCPFCIEARYRPIHNKLTFAQTNNGKEQKKHQTKIFFHKKARKLIRGALSRLGSEYQEPLISLFGLMYIKNDILIKNTSLTLGR
jgi:hypothetical protein